MFLGGLMNELERLSSNNQENYLRYLRRMTESMKVSTKGLIPIMCSDKKNILDVGCGSGVLMQAIENTNPKATITGIDLNEESINKLKKLGNNWKLYHTDLMNLSKNKHAFDTVIFSSVLHEVSSYCDDLEKRFTSVPIEECFQKANELLCLDGIIILRDGLLIDKKMRNQKVYITFKNHEDVIWLYRFQKDFQGFDKLIDVDRDIKVVNKNTFIVGLTFLKEFLYTFTWGKSSYPREVKERFGILDKETWLCLLEESGFYIDTVVESREEYEKYLSPKVEITNINGNTFTYPMMSILVKAKKNKELVKY